MGKMPLEFDKSFLLCYFFRQSNAIDEIHKNTMDNFYGLTVVRNLLLWYPDANNAEGHPCGIPDSQQGRPQGLPLPAYSEKGGE